MDTTQGNAALAEPAIVAPEKDAPQRQAGLNITIVALVLATCTIGLAVLMIVVNGTVVEAARDQLGRDTADFAPQLADRAALWFVSPQDADADAVVRAAAGQEYRLLALTNADGTPLGAFSEVSLPRPTNPITASHGETIAADGLLTAYSAIATADGGAEVLALAMQRRAPAGVPALPFLLVGGFMSLALVLALQTIGAKREALRKQQESAIAGLVASKAESLRRLNQVDRAKSDFLTAISHSFRTPLQVIEGIANLLGERAGDMDPATISTLSKRLNRNATRLDGLLRDLLDVDRLTRGAMTPARHELDAALVVRDAVEAMGVGDRVSQAQAEVPGNVDPAHLERMVEHVVKNAISHSPEGTEVEVVVEREEADDAFRVTVLDRGPGIPQEERLRVFDPLYRIEDGNPDPGSGIGLALVQRLAAAHGGRAWAEERVDGGCAVMIRIPDVGNDRGVDLWQLSGNVSS